MSDGPLILVVDDEPMILLDIDLSLRDAGLRTRTARNLANAQKLAAAHDFAAAVLDVNLGGGETCEPVAETLRAQNVPFMLHSGDLDRQGELIGRLDAPILPKPAGGQRVAAAVMDLLK